MMEELIKQIKGDRVEKRYFNEVFFNQLFSTISVPLLRTNLQLKQITLKKINKESLNNSDLKIIGEHLALIHRKCQTLSSVWPPGILDRYNAQKKYSDLINSSKEKVTKPKIGLTHGDYRLRNIMKDKKKIYISDWEFGGLNFIYWDLAIFCADFLHNQFHKNYGGLSLINFIEGYFSKNYLSDDELNFSLTLGAVDVIFDHTSPRVGEKIPEPNTLFKNITKKEIDFLLGTRLKNLK